METDYLFICDVLGFSNIVTDSSEHELSGRARAWVTPSTAAANKAGVKGMQLISDTFLASAPSTCEGLGQLVSYAQTLLNDGAPQSLPIRGAISHGLFEWGQLTYGKAVIAAHRLESSLEWVGVACDNELPHVEDQWGISSLVCYPAPERTGMIRLRPVVRWQVPRFKELERLLCPGFPTRSHLCDLLRDSELMENLFK
jgi:hypothetical protein